MRRLPRGGGKLCESILEERRGDYVRLILAPKPVEWTLALTVPEVAVYNSDSCSWVISKSYDQMPGDRLWRPGQLLRVQA